MCQGLHGSMSTAAFILILSHVHPELNIARKNQENAKHVASSWLVVSFVKKETVFSRYIAPLVGQQADQIAMKFKNWSCSEKSVASWQRARHDSSLGCLKLRNASLCGTNAAESEDEGPI